MEWTNGARTSTRQWVENITKFLLQKLIKRGSQVSLRLASTRLTPWNSVYELPVYAVWQYWYHSSQAVRARLYSEVGAYM
jgi:hypothetical protein